MHDMNINLNDVREYFSNVSKYNDKELVNVIHELNLIITDEDNFEHLTNTGYKIFKKIDKEKNND